MLKMSDLQSLSIEELVEKETKLKKDLMQARFQSKTGKLERQNVLSETKKDIARVLTVISAIRKKEKEEVKS